MHAFTTWRRAKTSHYDIIISGYKGRSYYFSSLKCKDHTVAFGVGLLFNIDFAVNHGHDAVSELENISSM
jgi:hypothetical protein